MIEQPSDQFPTGRLPAPGDVMLRLTGEITTKGRRTRSRFQKQLADNVRDSLESSGASCRIRSDWSRLYVRADVPVEDPLSRVFGISSFSVVEAECRADLDEIVKVGRATFIDRVRGKRFAVRARRAGRHSFNSQDVKRELGSALLEGASVDLTDPEVEVCVEVRDDVALFYSGRTAGSGGLPLGVEGRAVCLLSGGFDSAVAAWMMLRRGVALDYVFCNLGGDAYQRMVLEVASVLADRWSYGTRPTLLSLDFDPVVAELRRAFRPALSAGGPETGDVPGGGGRGAPPGGRRDHHGRGRGAGVVADPGEPPGDRRRERVAGPAAAGRYGQGGDHIPVSPHRYVRAVIAGP